MLEAAGTASKPIVSEYRGDVTFELAGGAAAHKLLKGIKILFHSKWPSPPAFTLPQNAGNVYTKGRTSKMRKMKKINGYLVVRFNDREKREYEDTGLRDDPFKPWSKLKEREMRGEGAQS